VRTLEGPADAGLNRVIWDLRSGAPAGLGEQRGPFVVPGSYTATVRAAGRDSTATVKVDPDAAFPVTDADRKLRFQFLTDALTLQADLAQAVTAVRAVRDQLTPLQEQLKHQPSPPASVVDSVARLGKVLADLQSRLGGGGGGGGEEGGGGGGGGLRARLSSLFSELDGSGIHQGTLSGPTAGQRQRLEAARKDAQALQGEVDKVLGAELAALNDEIARMKVPRIVRPR
jgi:hypothetical protein